MSLATSKPSSASQTWLTFLKGPYECSEAPDGGWGWVIAAGAFTIYVSTVGIQYCIGLIYRALLLDTEFTAGWSRAELAIVPSLESAHFLGGSLLAGILINKYGVRATMLIGTAFLVVGFLSSALVTNPAMLYLTYGCLCGLGCSLPSSSAIVMVARYFKKRRVTAAGFAVAGSGVGALIFGPLVEVVVAQAGWRGACYFLALCNAIMVPLATIVFIPIVIVKDPSARSKASAADPAAASKADADVANKTSSLDTSMSSADFIDRGQHSATANAQAAAADEIERVDEAAVMEDAVTALAMADRPWIDWPEPSTPEATEAAQLGVFERQRNGSALGGLESGDIRRGGSSIIRRQNSSMAVLNARQLLQIKPFLVYISFIAVYGATWFVVMSHYVTSAQEFGTNPTDSSLLILAQGVANTIGRASLGVLSDHMNVPKLTILQGCVYVVGLATALLSVLGQYYWYQVTYMLINGLCGGSIVSLQAPISVDLVGLVNLPLAQGLFHMAQAPLVLISPPIAGQLRSVMPDYTSVWAINGVWMVFSAFLCGFVDPSVGIGMGFISSIATKLTGRRWGQLR